jgi:hypothetical protein
VCGHEIPQALARGLVGEELLRGQELDDPGNRAQTSGLAEVVQFGFGGHGVAPVSALDVRGKRRVLVILTAEYEGHNGCADKKGRWFVRRQNAGVFRVLHHTVRVGGDPGHETGDTDSV